MRWIRSLALLGVLSAAPALAYTPTPIDTKTVTATATITQTPTATPTITATRTSTATSTATRTSTATSTATRTGTVTSTPTVTRTGTVTSTPTITQTPTQTPTLTPYASAFYLGAVATVATLPNCIEKPANHVTLQIKGSGTFTAKRLCKVSDDFNAQPPDEVGADVTASGVSEITADCLRICVDVTACTNCKVSAWYRMSVR